MKYSVNLVCSNYPFTPAPAPSSPQIRSLPDILAIPLVHGDVRLPTDLAQLVPLEVVHLVRGRGEPHRADVVRARVGRDRVRARLPDARREVEPRVCARGAVPVHEELRGARALVECRTGEESARGDVPRRSGPPLRALSGPQRRALR